MISNKLITDCHSIARGFAPKDTLNLSKNAIKIVNRSSNGFTIRYSSVDANYIGFVEEGTKYQDAQHFIARTYIELSMYLNTLGRKNTNKITKSINTARQLGDIDLYKDNPDYRRLVHAKSIYQHYETQGMKNKDGSDMLYRKR